MIGPIPNPLLSAALARPEHPMLIDGGERYSALELARRATGLALRLREEGVKAEQTVALIGAASARWVIGWHALGLLGCQAAILPPGAAPEAVDFALACGEEDLRACQALQSPHAMVGEAEADPFSALAERFWPLEEVRAILSSSGSSGLPRRIPLSTGQLMISAFGSTARLGHALSDRWLACMPLHHVGGLSIITRCTWLGTTVELHRGFSAERVARSLDGGLVTLVSLVPTMLDRVLAARPVRPFPARLRAILLGGAPATASLIERCRAIDAPISLTWGMSEAASQVATRTPGDLSASGGSGAPLPFVRVQSAGGRLLVRGPVVAGGELTSDDMGYLDERGRVHVVGRADRVIISGGEKIAPEPIEALLCASPGVAEAAVIARADRRWGQRPVAMIVPANGARVDAEALRARCQATLRSLEVPDDFFSCRELPRTHTGKIAYAALAEQLPRSVHAADEALEASSSPTLQRLAENAEGTSLPAVAERLQSLRRWLATDLGPIESQLLELDGGAGQAARRAAHHLLRQPGKRLRPICVLLGARIDGQTPSGAVVERARALALVCELVHAATLLHDDVIDLGTERRGASTARVIYGNTASVLGGDHLLTEALRRVERYGSPTLLSRLIDVIDEMVGAEVLQLEQKRSFVADAAIYRAIVQGKTAALFSWALEAGARVAGVNGELIEALDRVGRALGEAFQLVDDLLDFESADSGKDALADLREGKLTWPLLVAAGRDGALLVDLRQALAGDDDALPEIAARVRRCGAIEATRNEARRQAADAHRALLSLPASRARNALESVIRFSVARVS